VIPPFAADMAFDFGTILAGLGGVGAGTGLLFAGIKFGRFSERSGQAAMALVTHFEKIQDLQERQAIAAEKQAEAAGTNTRMLELIQRLGEDREDISRTMRVISRKHEWMQGALQELLDRQDGTREGTRVRPHTQRIADGDEQNTPPA